MFSGVIRDLGEVVEIRSQDEGIELYIKAQPEICSLSLGSSLAVNGICLTITAVKDGVMRFDVASETLRVTTAGLWELGEALHLEPALCIGDSIDGHLVSGHIDTVSKIHKIEQEGDTWRFEFSLNDDIKKFIARKGSVCIDGVSLTIGEVSDTAFSVYIIPHTFNSTRFSQYTVEDSVNIEVDMLARYTAHQLQFQEST